MKGLFLAAVIAVVLPYGTGDTKLGAGVTLQQATPINALLERPAEFTGKTVRIYGVATAVCEVMGCWLAVAAEDGDKSRTVRLKVEDGVIVFPLTAKGQKVSAQGVFEEVGATDGHGQEAASEHASHEPKATKRYHIAATGAVIR